MQQAIEKIIVQDGLDLKTVTSDLVSGKVALEGDVSQIWADRQWHPHTKNEIYLLIWVGKQLGFHLPILVLERIGFWLQLIELIRDFQSGELKPIFRVRKFSWFAWVGLTYTSERNESYWFTQNIRVESNFSCEEYVWISNQLNYFQTGTFKENPGYARMVLNLVKQCLERKDRYRIVLANRAELDYIQQRLESLLKQ